MKGIRIGRVFGIEVTVHWTFFLLLLWVGLMGWSGSAPLFERGGPIGFVSGVALAIGAFACVLLHEFGHSLTARRFGIETRGNTLLPIGGVARLERMPRKPTEELWITIAGPAVNLAIAIALIPLVWLTDFWLLDRLMWVNVVLLVFNLIPAFPMDGGRILRALLATRLPYGRATHIAARTGQGLAIAYGVISLFAFNLIGVILSAFIFGAATAERWAVLAGFDDSSGGGPRRPGGSGHPGSSPFARRPRPVRLEFVRMPPTPWRGHEERRWRNLTPDGPRDGV
jgi:Zn-dependent protease